MGLLIFDWDDTIVMGAKKGYMACFEHALKRVNIDMPRHKMEERVLSRWGTTHEEAMAALLYNSHPRVQASACTFYREALIGGTYLEHLSILPGTKEKLQDYACRHTLCIATGSVPEVVEHQAIPKFGLDRIFSRIVYGSQLQPEQRKPSRFIVDFLMDAYGMMPNYTRVIGDADPDRKMAVNAGVPFILVKTGIMTALQGRSQGVRRIVEDVRDLDALVKGI